MVHLTNTPGPRGYLTAWLVSASAFGVPTALSLSEPSGDLVGALARFLVLFVVTVVVSVPVGAVGVLAVHLLCRSVEPQWMHVLAAGGVGYVAICWASPPMGVVLGVCTALGRLAAVPLVWRRRETARAGA